MKFKKSKSLKWKFVLAGFLLLISAFFSSLLSHFLVMNLTGKYKNILSINAFITSIKTDTKHQILFFILTGTIWLAFCYLVFFANHLNATKTGMRRLTPEIEIPVEAGQKQYGASEFLSDEKMTKHFSEITINLKDPCIKMLISEGKKDSKFIKKDVVRKVNMKITEPILNDGGMPISFENTKTEETYRCITGDLHTIIYGTTGSSKTRRLMIQSCDIQALAGKDMLFSDPKGELYLYHYVFLERLNYAVFPIDFKNPMKSVKYNFLEQVIQAMKDNDIPKAIAKCWDFADNLVVDSQNENPLWSNGEKGILASAIMLVVYDNSVLGLKKQYPNATDVELNNLYETKHKYYQNCSNLYYFLAQISQTNEETGELWINDIIAVLPDSHPAKLTLMIVESAPIKTRGTFITSALATLRLFTDPNIAQMTNETALDMFDTTKKKAIFIILPDTSKKYYPLASLIVNQFYQYMAEYADEQGGRLDREFYINADEFGNFTKIPDCNNKLTVARSRGIRFNLCLQSQKQLVEIYGENIASILTDSCDYQIYLKSNEESTLKLFSDKSGPYTVLSTSGSTSVNNNGSLFQSSMNGSSSSSTNLMGRPLLFPNEVSHIERPYILTIANGFPCLTKSPDLSEWAFNDMLGLGNKAHNTKLRKVREKNRLTFSIKAELALWDFKEFYGTLVNQKTSEKQKIDREEKKKREDNEMKTKWSEEYKLF
ncbi:MAG: type IV secretory system conjugative DNA transfer family protein [Oscillospiraceae bacterium]